uniref:Uncharacterized protein n=1 Tax=Oryza barthii TaxID=65489 RepID=A0A0D3G141_9ORYZ
MDSLFEHIRRSALASPSTRKYSTVAQPNPRLPTARRRREGKRIGDLLRSSDGGIWVFAQSFRQTEVVNENHKYSVLLDACTGYCNQTEVLHASPRIFLRNEREKALIFFM